MAPTAAMVARAMTQISAFDRMPWTRGLPARQCGFTLLELLLVLGILGMAATLIGPGLASLNSPGFTAQVREATGLLNYARRMAVVQGTPAAIEMQGTGGDTGDRDNVDDSRQQADIVGRWTGDNIVLNYRDSAGQDAPPDERLQITFFPEGGSTGGELILQQDGRQLTISVDPFSGRVQVLDEE